jgi:hypothetical protein
LREYGSALFVFALASDAAFAAGGGYLVDDAAITAASSCQAESWVRRSSSGANEMASTPACTEAGVEYSLTLARDAGAGEGANAFTPGLTWVWGDIGRGRWAAGFAATATLVDGRVDNALLYAPISVALASSSDVVMHVNVGERQQRGGHIDALYGIGMDVAAARQWHVLAEGIRAGPRERTWQSGVRWIFSKALTIDLVYGLEEASSSGRWLTLGFNVAP